MLGQMKEPSTSSNYPTNCPRIIANKGDFVTKTAFCTPKFDGLLKKSDQNVSNTTFFVEVVLKRKWIWHLFT